VYTTEQQLVRVYAAYNRKPDPLEKYIYLVSAHRSGTRCSF